MKALLSFFGFCLITGCVGSADPPKSETEEQPVRFYLEERELLTRDWGYWDKPNREVLVDFKNDTKMEDLAKALHWFRWKRTALTDREKIVVVTPTDGSTYVVESPLVEGVYLRQKYKVDVMERNVVADADVLPTKPDPNAPNDPLYPLQWNMRMIHAKEAWSAGPLAMGQTAVVAVIDTGVSDGSGKFKRVPDLWNTEIIDGFNFTSDEHSMDPYDIESHGTHVAGTIAQSTNNAKGVVGVAPLATIMPIKVLGDDGYGYDDHIAAGIYFAVDSGAHVINLSIGGGAHSRVIGKALKYAESNNVFVACSAGNNLKSSIGYPAKQQGCHAVTALGPKGKLAWYSNHGKGVFLAAPGGDTKADYDNGGILQNTILPGAPQYHGYLGFQGTSMAAPHVAGVAAIAVALLGVDKYTLEDVRQVLSDGATKKQDPRVYGNGIVDALGTVKAAEKIVAARSMREIEERNLTAAVTRGGMYLIIIFLAAFAVVRSYRQRKRL